MKLTMRRDHMVRGAVAVGATVVLAAAAAPAIAATTHSSPHTTAAHTASHSSMADMSGMSMPAGSHGPSTYGMTKAFFNGKALSFTYTKGYFCDTSVSSAATTNCEVGAPWKHAPASQHDPLFITVPLGFSPRMQECPSRITCVDHPWTVDLSRLEPALKPLYPKLTDAQLTAALQNFGTPGHDHFITDTNGGRPEWWDVQVVGVTNPKIYAAIQSHQSYAYIQTLLKKKTAGVLGPIPSNIFLYFSVQS